MELDKEIKDLISKKQEGEYWDFKEYHHTNTSNLLHDIICMANNMVDRDAYIIFGVNETTKEVVGIGNDINRRNQEYFVEHLKNKKFAGGVRPMIEFRTIEILNHEIDVLVIKNTRNTPYYLIENSKEDKGRFVRANYIYTRICDTNTDIDKSTDINNVEYLWKKRFGLISSDKIRNYYFSSLRLNLIVNELAAYENQQFMKKMNNQYGIINQDIDIEVPRDTVMNFELPILEKCKQLYEPINLSENEDIDNYAIKEQFRKQSLFSNSIIDRYLPNSTIYNNIRNLIRVCEDFLKSKELFITLNTFDFQEIDNIYYFKYSCERYIEQLNESLIIARPNVAVQYRSFFNSKYALLDSVKGLLNVNDINYH